MRALGVGHVHSPWANANALVALVASRLMGVGFSVQARAHDLHRDDTAFALPTKFRHARFVVTNTRYNEAGVRALLPDGERAKVHRIHNGIDLADFVPLRVPNDDGVARILTVARLIEPKGLTLLLRACAALRDRGVAFRCDVIGGPEEPLYTAYRVQLGVLHRQLDLAPHVRFRGALPFAEVLDAYRTADLFVLPCVEAANGSKDITPNALIEAMAMGLPVISTRMTGIPEIVDDGCSGVLVAPGDVDALTDAMLALLDDPERRARLGVEARRAVEARFDIRTNVREYVRLFRDVC
jgi:glycosyltransferase involved in cell wall biosynthesis